jgi:hypothetical protein
MIGATRYASQSWLCSRSIPPLRIPDRITCSVFPTGGRHRAGRDPFMTSVITWLEAIVETFVPIIASGYLGSFIVLVPGAQTFESLKDLGVLLASCSSGIPPGRQHVLVRTARVNSSGYSAAGHSCFCHLLARSPGNCLRSSDHRESLQRPQSSPTNRFAL